MASLHSHKQEISGRTVWAGSLTLANAFLQLPENEKRERFDRKRILELGSGTGVLGMAIYRMCAASHKPGALILTDGDDTATELLQSNLQNERNHIDRQKVQACSLLWGKTPSGCVSPVFTQWCRQANTTWNESDDVLFDCIVAGDVLYKADLSSVFFETAFSLLSKRDANNALWLCHIPRHGVTHQLVVDAARDAGFSVHVQDPPVGVVRGCSIYDVKRSVIYRCSIA